LVSSNSFQGPKSLIGAVLGGAIGFGIGLLGGLPFGILGCSGPLVGAIFGAILGAVAPPVVSLSFLAGGVVAAPIIFVRYNQLAHSLIGAPWSTDAAPSLGYAATPLILAIAGCVIAGSAVGLIVTFSHMKIDRSRRFATVGVLLSIGIFGAIVFAIGSSIFESWTSFEANYQQTFRDSVAAEKKRLAPGPRDLPVRDGPFLYPNRLDLKGDSFIITMRTADSTARVLEYYQRLGADMQQSREGWEGVFNAEGKRLRVRVSQSQSGSAISLRVDGF
jgi:hypothetical protein